MHSTVGISAVHGGEDVKFQPVFQRGIDALVDGH